MTTTQVVLATIVILAGSCLQGAVGFGVNLVAAPLLLLVSERFVPGPIIVASFFLNVLVVRREGTGAVDPNITTAIGGQVVGATAAGITVALVSDRGLSIIFAVIVLLAVVLSAVGWVLAPTRRALIGAGTASGFMGTISGIGGPPIALVYQRADGPTLRATLGRFFLVGALVSIVTLLVVGELDADAIAPTLWLIPGMVAGFLLSRGLARRIDGGAARPVVLILSALSAVAVLVREVL